MANHAHRSRGRAAVAAPRLASIGGCDALKALVEPVVETHVMLSRQIATPIDQMRGASRRLGQIVAGQKPGRESDAESNLRWRRGLSQSDIALGHARLARAERLGIARRLRFA
jgi:ornithine cyclodeaminase/alanine dehydrogenase-like protein (mu-crystallin family)